MAALAARGHAEGVVVVGLERGLGVLECGGAPEDGEGGAGLGAGERRTTPDLLLSHQSGCSPRPAPAPAPCPPGCCLGP